MKLRQGSDSMLKLKVSIDEIPIRLSLKDTTVTIDNKLDTIYERTSGGKVPPDYEGNYEVTPRKIGQTLATENTVMKKDVRINPITYSSVDNPYGGQTITIGLE